MSYPQMNDLLKDVVETAISVKIRFFRNHHAEPQRFALSSAAFKAAKDYSESLALHPIFIDLENPPAQRSLTLWGIEVVEDPELPDNAVRAER